MLIYIDLPLSLQPKAIAVACYITNRLPIKALNKKTPYKTQYKKKLDLFNLYLSGCNAYVINYYAKSQEKMAQWF